MEVARHCVRCNVITSQSVPYANWSKVQPSSQTDKMLAKISKRLNAKINISFLKGGKKYMKIKKICMCARYEAKASSRVN